MHLSNVYWVSDNCNDSSYEIKLPSCEQLLWDWTNCFLYFASLIPLDNPTRHYYPAPPSKDVKVKAHTRVSNSLRVTQLFSGTAGIWTQAGLFQAVPGKVLSQTLHGRVAVSSPLNVSSPGGERREVEPQLHIKKKLAGHRREVQVNQLFLTSRGISQTGTTWPLQHL